MQIDHKLGASGALQMSWEAGEPRPACASTELRGYRAGAGEVPVSGAPAPLPGQAEWPRDGMGSRIRWPWGLSSVPPLCGYVSSESGT